jgi:hypothetical protein
LDPQRRYEVRFENSGRSLALSGRALAEEGVAVEFSAASSSELLLIRAEG